MYFSNKFIIGFFSYFLVINANGSKDYSLPNAISQKEVLEKIENKLDDQKFSSSLPNINKLKNLKHVLVKEESCFYIEKVYLDYGNDYSLAEGKDFFYLNSKLNKKEFIINSCVGEKTLNNIF